MAVGKGEKIKGGKENQREYDGGTTILRRGGRGSERRETGRRNQQTIVGRTLRVIVGGIK